MSRFSVFQSLGLFTVAVVHLLVLSPSARAAEPLVSALVAEPPVLDGRLDAGEWPLERAAALEHGQLVVVHDSARLYLLLNLQADTEEDAADRVTVFFDVDGNGAPSPGVDRRFVVDSSSPKLLVEELQGPGAWAPSPLRTASARAAGFGGFFADGTRMLRPTGGSEPTSEHRVWELAIDLSEIDATLGETARFRVLVESTTPSIQEWYPPGPGGIAGGLEVGLPGRFVEVPGGPTGSGPVLGSPPLEVTQAVQTIDNALPLVSEKTTVARVYVSAAGTNGFLTVQLHASRGGADLSGSPLVQVFLEQPGTAREDLGHTANFLLPDGWPEGDVEFQVVARDSFGRSVSSDVIPISFTCKETPTYWIVPADLGSGAMAPAGTIAIWQSYLETIFPVPRIDWVQQPSLGVVAEDDLIDELAEYRAGWLLVWLLGVLATQQEPFPFPDQVIGVVSGAVNAGGRSDPFWSTNGDGVDQGTVCWIATNNNGAEVGMSHEVNHNLDTDPTGTWGRHVSNPCDGFQGGTDGSWPYADDLINEIGFDTRSPWSGSGSPLTVVPADFPDIMSRCKADDVGYPNLQLPSRWISPYRWESLFHRLPTLSPCLVANPLPGDLLDRIRPTIQVSGILLPDGRGRLRPAFQLPGLAGEPGTTGPYAVELVGDAGETIVRHRFSASFVDVEGVEVGKVPFRFQLPANRVADVRGIRLIRDGQELDRIVASATAPELEIEELPAGPFGDRRTLQWTANDVDGDDLQFHVIYSPDGGSRWFPVARRALGRALEIESDRLPGGNQGKFRVIASDGFHTVEAETSEPVEVANKAPRAAARLLRRDGEILAGELVRFVGFARDPEDGRLSGDRLVWKAGDRLLGSGDTLRTRLPAGTWGVELEAFDGEGASGTATVTVTVAPREPLFSRGDVDGSGGLDITDPIAILGYLFLGTIEPECLDALDADDDGQVSLSDAIGLLLYQFQGGAEPPAPFGSCGVDPTPDELGCEDFGPCVR